jgi:hypothetical protein
LEFALALKISARIAAMSVATTTFYSSSNGDRWLLSHDDETGSYLVRHEPNLNSGGQATEMPIPTFQPAAAPAHRRRRYARCSKGAVWMRIRAKNENRAKVAKGYLVLSVIYRNKLVSVFLRV